MWRYILRRILLLIPVVLGVAILVFVIMDACPGDAADIIAGSTATEEVVETLRENLGLNDPYLVRLGRYLKQTFIDFDLGSSYMSGVPVSTELLSRFPNTLILSISGILISLVVGIPLGIYAATHQSRPGDYVSMAIALLGVSIPTFWLSLMLVVLFAYELEWLPPYGSGGIEYWILPIVSSCLNGIGMMARQMRSATLEVINSDYIVMARSKGLSERKVLFRHALPNALIPVITVCGTSFGMSLGGGMLVETIFSIPGIGYYMVKGVNNRDYPVVQGSVLVLAILFSLIMLATDLVMAGVDPRIKAQFAGKKKQKKSKEAKANV